MLEKWASFHCSYMASTAEAKKLSLLGEAISDVITRIYAGISNNKTVNRLF